MLIAYTHYSVCAMVVKAHYVLCDICSTSRSMHLQWPASEVAVSALAARPAARGNVSMD